MSISIDFQKRIVDLVEEAGNKKSELSKNIGIDYRSLSNSINYGIVPKPKILIRIANYFNVSLNYLLGKTNDDYFVISSEPCEFKSRFILLCRQKNVTYYKLSQDCHFDKSYVSRWLSKNYLPSLEILEILSDYFDVSLDFLLGRTDDRN